MSYGLGIHRCIGAPLAQIELSILFRRLIDARFPLVPTGEVSHLRSNFILGITRLPGAFGGNTD